MTVSSSRRESVTERVDADANDMRLDTPVHVYIENLVVNARNKLSNSLVVSDRMRVNATYVESS